jgi:predicted adenylyl cyclase CyaB
MGHLNIEIKAKCSDHGKVRSVLKSHNADFEGVDHQIDTYFKVPNGRLKLREGNIENYLIFYEREDKEGPKQSNVILHKTEPDSSLKETLTKSLGILAIVDKQREIYFIDNVKFHLDSVQDLGTFMEIEAIDTTGNIGQEKLLEQCNHYLELFGTQESDLLKNSYSDQILRS